MTPTQLRDQHKGLLLKDLRIQLRKRGLNPAGGREALLDRLVDGMMASGDQYVPSHLRSAPLLAVGRGVLRNVL
jgi:hypothetical protein